MSNIYYEKVTSVHHWNDTLFSFTCTRDPGLRFINGQFVMIGLIVNDKPLMRAYSIVSPNYEDQLEFYSIKVQDGPLTSRLQHLKVGDEVTAVVSNVDRKTRQIQLSVKAKDAADQQDAMAAIKDSSAKENAGTTT